MLLPKISFKELLDDQPQILRLYGTGAALFFVGIGFIIWADQMLAPSLDQEAIALMGTAVGGLGFITAMSAQLLLIVNRFKYAGNKR